MGDAESDWKLSFTGTATQKLTIVLLFLEVRLACWANNFYTAVLQKRLSDIKVKYAIGCPVARSARFTSDDTLRRFALHTEPGDSARLAQQAWQKRFRKLGSVGAVAPLRHTITELDQSPRRH